MPVTTHVCARGGGHGQELVLDEVRLGGGGRANVVCLIGLASACTAISDQAYHLNVEAVLVGVRVDGDGTNAELASRADHAACNLSTVGVSPQPLSKRPTG